MDDPILPNIQKRAEHGTAEAGQPLRGYLLLVCNRGLINFTQKADFGIAALQQMLRGDLTAQLVIGVYPAQPGIIRMADDDMGKFSLGQQGGEGSVHGCPMDHQTVGGLLHNDLLHGGAGFRIGCGIGQRQRVASLCQKILNAAHDIKHVGIDIGNIFRKRS